MEFTEIDDEQQEMQINTNLSPSGPSFNKTYHGRWTEHRDKEKARKPDYGNLAPSLFPSLILYNPTRPSVSLACVLVGAEKAGQSRHQVPVVDDAEVVLDPAVELSSENAVPDAGGPKPAHHRRS